MSAEAFARWLAEMRSAGLARSDAECGRLLGVTPNAILKMKANGTTQSVALACRALLKKLKPYA